MLASSKQPSGDKMSDIHVFGETEFYFTWPVSRTQAHKILKREGYLDYDVSLKSHKEDDKLIIDSIKIEKIS